MRVTALSIVSVALVLTACVDDTGVVGPADSTTASFTTAGFKQADKDLVAEGRRLFFEETFGGNGRTCGTCHIEPSFTITPADIAKLPRNDPLFKGALDVNMHFIKRALFQYPLGGILVQRATPGVFNMKGTEPFLADGRAPNLEAVIVGATTLHLLDGAVDKKGERLPTADEIEAMVAFQESVHMPEKSRGRGSMGEEAVAGQELFNTKAACATCHFGGLLTDNSFHNTGVVNDTEGDIYVGDLPFDPGACRLNPNGNDCETSGANFNTPQLRGVRVTGPYFHNNSRATLRGVVEFYNSDIFASSPANQRLGIGPLNLTEEEIDLITAFLEGM